MKRRMLAIFLTLMMLLSLLPTAAFAEEVCEHKYDITVMKEATCTANGIQKSKCSKCGDTKYSAIPAGHKNVSEDGICGVCGELIYGAKIGDLFFDTLKDAVAEAVKISTDINMAAPVAITVLSDHKSGGIMVTAANPVNMVIDLGGHTVDFVEPAVGSKGTESQALHLEKGSKITLKNGTLTSRDSRVLMLIQNYCDLTLQDVTLDGNSKYISYVLSNNNGSAVLEGKTNILAYKGMVAFDVYDWRTQGYSGVNVTVNTTGIIDGKVEVGGTGDATPVLNVKNGTFTQPIAVDKNYAETATVNLTGGSFAEEVKPAEDYHCLKAADGTYKVGKCEFEEKVVDASCESAAGVKFTCKVCGAEKFEEFTDPELAKPQLKHEYEAVVTAPTCKDKGYTTHTCKLCGDTYKDAETDIVPDAHVAKLVKTLKEATCTTTGIGKYACAICGADMGYKVIETTHTWDKGVVTKEATCGKAGEMKFTCSKCGETKTEEIKATGKHDYEEQIVESCTEIAQIGQVCKICGEKGALKPVEGSEPLGHDLVLDKTNKNYKAATCDEGGVDTLKCSRCDYTEEKATKALGHKWDDGEVVDASCESAAGVKYVCTVCGDKMFEEFTEEGLAKPKLEHEYEAVVTAPTCKDKGYTIYTCKLCGNSYKDAETAIDKNAHVQKLDKVLREATCTTTGIGKYVCSLCGADLGYKVIPADHNWDEGVVTKEATCGKDGEKKLTCSVCGETKTEKIPATGKHSFQENIVEATCTEGAKIGQVCAVCGETTGELKPVEGSEPLGHDLVLDKTNKNYKAATCDEGGVDTLKCSRCDYTEEKATEALGHKWDDGEVVDASCESAAGVKYVCTVCGDKMFEEFTDPALAKPKLEHAYESVVTAPTCKDKGYTTYTCKLCGDSYTDNETEPVADAHVAKLDKVLREATCTTTGIGKYVCQICGADMGYKVIEAGHDWDEGVVTKEANCGVDGEKLFTCSVCGETKIEKIAATGEHTWGEDKLDDATSAVIRECEVCGAREVLYIEDETLRDCALGNHKAVEIPATETHLAGKKCSVCGTILEAPVAKCAHENTEIIPGNAATCTEAGMTDGKKCKDCGAELQAQEEIPALGHTEEVLPAVEANCGNAGLTEGKKCSVCGEILIAQEEIPAAGAHTEEIIPGKAATCTEAGLTEGKRCSVCGEILIAQEEIPALGHTEEVIPGKEATCCEAGLTEGKKCSVCGEILAAQEEIPATGKHSFIYSNEDSYIDDDGIAHIVYLCEECGAKTENP